MIPLLRLAPLALTLLCAPSMLVAAQQSAPLSAPDSAPVAIDESDPHSSPPPIVATSELRMAYFVARRASADELLAAIDGLATRLLYVRNADGSITGPVENVRRFGQSGLLLYDVPDRTQEIMQTLNNLEQATVQMEAMGDEDTSASPLDVAEYSPQHISLDGLLQALQPFTREIDHNAFNITAIDVPARVVLRDSADNVQQMLTLLRTIDVPAPQLMLHCWLLRGIDHDGAAGLPAQLVENLQRLVPFAGFEQVSSAFLRISVVAGQQHELRGLFGDQRFEVKLEPAGYDATTQSLTLARCAFNSTTGQEFATAAVVRAGEYVVLGAAGSDPLFVVLRVTPVDG